MKSEVAYKVVARTHDHNVFESSTVQGAHCLRYEIGKTTIPKAGGVLCFETINMALGLRRDIDAVIAVEYGERIALPSKRLAWCFCCTKYELSTHAIRTAWKNELPKSRSSSVRLHGREYVIDDWPEGTVAFEWVKPVMIIVR